MQFVLGGPTYEQLVQWRDHLFDASAQENPRPRRGSNPIYEETQAEDHASTST